MEGACRMSYILPEAEFEMDRASMAKDNRIAELSKALRTLVTRLDEIFASSEYQSLFVLAAVRGHPYNGPRCEAEMIAAKEALAASTTTETPK